jgi:lipopolysaccharide transport system ATP-binding protein
LLPLPYHHDELTQIAAGKTTLLKILGRLTSPTEGRATVSGRVVSLREFTVKMVPDLSGRENLILSAGFHGFTDDDVLRRLDEIVAFAETPDLIDRPTKSCVSRPTSSPRRCTRSSPP